ncbi:maltooligosyltrehalose trehalohydrolase [Micromonospora pattaloongensis]|uniref:Maltooligosyltrehalose trehalohydrolase n=1 Tax=Micromonospora pattaloongensis TaxID=405436 RepID=A0A1H3JA88_9ACTN|nr:DUF3459 domain-containing protein [Micromonospora pattaloongensis]SDY36475.1 maltooligosyltrehalose trehalohydrolase [Micromonospora pattaloongensis]
MTAAGVARPRGAGAGRTRAGHDLRGGVLYRLRLPTFTPQGTVAAAVDRLPHLGDLGVEVVELRGVDTSPDLPAFVDAAHARGLGVVLHVEHERFDADSDAAQHALVSAVARRLREHHLDGLRVRIRGRATDAAINRLYAQLAAEVTVLSVQLGRPLSLIVDSDVDGARLVVPSEAPAPGAANPERDFASLRGLTDVLARRPAAGLPALDVDDPVGREGATTLSRGLRRVATTLLLTGPAIPVLTMGEEWGATPVDEQRHVAEPAMVGAGAGRAAPRWSAATGRHADAVPLDWSERDRPAQRELLRLYRDLIALRRREPQLGTAPVRPDGVRRGDHFLTVRRGSRVVVANLGRTPRRVNVAGVPRRVLLATELGVCLTHDAVDLPPESAAVVECARFDRR